VAANEATLVLADSASSTAATHDEASFELGMASFRAGDGEAAVRHVISLPSTPFTVSGMAQKPDWPTNATVPLDTPLRPE
jgi:hypothetical protein